MDLKEIVKKALELNAGDIHIKAGSIPTMRIVRNIVKCPEFETPSNRDIMALIEKVLSKSELLNFKKNRDADVLYEIKGLCSLRINFFFQRRGLGLSARIIPGNIRPLQDLGYSEEAVKSIQALKKGLFLVTGPTNAGKTTTVSSIIDCFAKAGNYHIITLEDPVEFSFKKYNSSMVRQHQIGRDTPSFIQGINDALRQSPDLLVIGEMRDPDTIAGALYAAETGCLVISSFHTSSVNSTISRLISSFSSSRRDTIRHTLASVLQGISCQALLCSADKKSMVLAYETLFVNNAVRKVIREDRLNQLDTTMQLSRSKKNSANITMNDTVAKLLKEKKILYSSVPEEMRGKI
jgi:twitching motility protein PilT